ncbi:hypothetical protein ACFE04_002303 [Oxalis oulophora]
METWQIVLIVWFCLAGLIVFISLLFRSRGGDLGGSGYGDGGGGGGGGGDGGDGAAVTLIVLLIILVPFLGCNDRQDRGTQPYGGGGGASACGLGVGGNVGGGCALVAVVEVKYIDEMR